MRRSRTVLAVLVSLALAAGAAGCGGTGSGGGVSKQDYAKDLGQAGQTLQKTFADISATSTSSTSAQQIADRLDRGAQALDDAAARFAKITPPSEVKAAHQKLVDGLKELAAVFRRSAQAARHNDTKSLTSALQGLANSDGVKKITEAQHALEADGITVATTTSTTGG